MRKGHNETFQTERFDVDYLFRRVISEGLVNFIRAVGNRPKNYANEMIPRAGSILLSYKKLP